MNDKNKDTYRAAQIVDYYAQLQLLQPAEATILAQLREQLPTLNMLDIGVGGGRTTQHFAPLAKTYTGIDYSAAMIEACQRRFKQGDEHDSDAITLQVGDARNMAAFADNSFDFILFSFNGIDYVSHGDRLKILTEIKRIGKPDCYVFFSSHNLQPMAREFDWKSKISLNPLKTYVNLVMWVILRLFNFSITPKKLATSQHLVLRDESHNFGLQTYYIRAEAQIQQLENDFNNIEIYSWKSGLKIEAEQELSSQSDMWLYYLCRVSDRPKD